MTLTKTDIQAQRLERIKQMLPASVTQHLGVEAPGNRKQRRARRKLIRFYHKDRKQELQNRINSGKVFTVDLGKNSVHVYDCSTKKQYKISFDDFVNLNIEGLDSSCLVVMEESHYRSRGETSKAQALEYEQLLQLFDNAYEKGVMLYMFPQCNTPKARGFKFGVTAKPADDIQDCIAIADMVINRTDMASLREFVPISMEQFKSISAGRSADIQQLNEDANYWRNFDYYYADRATNPLGQLIVGCADYLAGVLTDTQKELLRFSFGKKGQLTGPGGWYNKVAYLIMTVVSMDDDGNLIARTRKDNGLVPNWRYVAQRLLGFSPYHFKAGTAASNVKMHMLQKHANYRIERPKIDPKKEDSKRVAWNDETHALLQDSRIRFRKDFKAIWEHVKHYALGQLQTQPA
jgi:hypothetical protein